MGFTLEAVKEGIGLLNAPSPDLQYWRKSQSQSQSQSQAQSQAQAQAQSANLQRMNSVQTRRLAKTRLRSESLK